MARIIATVQARVGSTRLPGKALALIEGEPMTWHVVRRLWQATRLDNVVLAIPARDRLLIQLAEAYGILYFTGSESDVLGRLCGAAQEFEADAIVRITGDCPMIDPDVVDRVVASYRGQYVSNVLPPTYPAGLAVEVYPRNLLAWLDQEIQNDEMGREWFACYLWERIGERTYHNVPHEVDLSHLRWTVDYLEDLEFARRVYAELGGDFRTADVLALLGRQPKLTILCDPDFDPCKPWKQRSSSC